MFKKKVPPDLTALALAALTLSFAAPAAATDFDDPGFVEEEIPRPDGGDWSGVAGLQFTADGRRAFAWERDGRVWILDRADPVTEPFLDLADEVLAWRDHGLLGFALDPAFIANGYVYAYYAVDRHHLEHCTEPQAGTGPAICDAGYDPAFSVFEVRATVGRITRYRARRPAGDADYRNATAVNYESRKVLLGERPNSACPALYFSHAVGALVFGTDRTLLASCGDSAAGGKIDVGGRNSTAWQEGVEEGILRPEENVGAYRAQMINSHAGKILRLDPATGDGVASNPFYDSASPRSAASRVWVLGGRNPYRMTVRPETGSHDPADGDPGTLYIGDVGWVTWEELAIVRSGGANLGWPAFEGIERQDEYWALSPLNEDAPNPLASGSSTCREHFRFTDLLQQATNAAAPNWPNPCNRARQIDSVPTFLHHPPALDWRHGTPETRFPAFQENGQLVAVDIGQTGPDGTTVTGRPFSGITSTAGIWYQGEDFPQRYRNTYFHADYGGQWIHNLVIDAEDRLVDVRPFATRAGGVVFLTTNPVEGALYYISWASAIRRVEYAPGGNRRPTAALSAASYFGPAPLAVTFDASASTDPEGGPLVYEWEFGDGASASGGPRMQHTFDAPSNTPTSYELRLTVTDPEGASSTTSALVSVNNSPPVVEITSPADGAVYSTASDSKAQLSASLSDPEQGAGSLSCRWQVIFHHNDHVHEDPPLSGCEQSVSFSASSCTVETFWYEVRLEVTDPAGLKTTKVSAVYPDCPGEGPDAGDDAAEMDENGTAVITVLANDTDDGSINPYSVRVVAAPAHGTATPDPHTGVVVYQQAAKGALGDQFRYIVRDNHGNPSNEATVTISGSAPSYPILLRHRHLGTWFSYGIANGQVVSGNRATIWRDQSFETVSRDDFNDDGVPDLFVRDVTGQFDHRWLLYTLDGQTVLADGNMPLPRGPEYVVVATEDFNNDGLADVLLRNTDTGEWTMSIMNVRKIRNQGPIDLESNPAWQPIGVGDFNGDGNADLLLRRGDGQWRIQLIDRRTVLATGTPGITTDTGYELKAIEDFDGDGRDEVLLRDGSGRWAMYALDGVGVRLRATPALNDNPAVTFEGIGDFNGDGLPDVLMRFPGAKWPIYMMNGAQVAAQGWANVANNAKVELVDIADINFDGRDDLILRHSEYGTWFYRHLDGATVLARGRLALPTSSAFRPEVE